jgi:hypothetical protein
MGKTNLPLMLILLTAAIGMSFNTGFAASACVDCHQKRNPSIVSDHQLSKHGKAGLDCTICHGDQHSSAADVANVQIPVPDTCATCHGERVKQYKAGKHAFAWAAMKAMPTMHWQPSILADEMKGCGGCHKIGLKVDEEIKEPEEDQSRIWDRILRRLPYAPYILCRRGATTPGVSDMSYGL